MIELWVLLTISLPVWIYFIFNEYYKQQTIGKRLLELMVVSEKGIKISLKQAFLRTFIRLLPWELTHIIILIPEPWWNMKDLENSYFIYIPNVIMIIYMVVLFWNKGTKGIHDYLSRTKVV
jgi:uncharacterized RDD family membrane protein YckC